MTASVRPNAAGQPALVLADLEVGFAVPRSVSGVLARREPDRVRAVDGIDLEVAPGELVALVGESGCGKTTTALASLGLVPTSGGSVQIDGQDLTRLPAGQVRMLRRRAQMIFQDPYESLDPRFTVRRTLTEPMVVHGLDGDHDEQVRGALERVGLHPAEAFLDRHPHELSGGQRQRVAIAAALVLEPTLLVADEPVSMLDTSVRAGVLDLLGRLRGDGMGILMITHDLSTAAAYADRIAVMYLGRIVEQGPARVVVGDPKHPYTRALVAAVPRSDARPRDRSLMPKGETPDATHIPAGCRFHPRCPLAEHRCQQQDPALVEVSAGRSAACLLVPALR